MKRLSVLSLAALCALSASAAVKFASPFGDGMVLQRGKSVAVWGTADAGEKVNVTFAGQSASATAGADGRWLVRLAPMEACAEGRVLSANGAEGAFSARPETPATPPFRRPCRPIISDNSALKIMKKYHSISFTKIKINVIILL